MKINRDSETITFTLTVNIRDVLARFGGVKALDENAMRKWLYGKIRQQVLTAFFDALVIPEEEADDVREDKIKR